MSPETKTNRARHGAPTTERKRWTAATSRELADKILDGQAEPEEVTKEYGLQSYQLWAWVGKRAHERARNAQREARRAEPKAAGKPAGGYSLEDVMQLAELLAKRRPGGAS